MGLNVGKGPGGGNHTLDFRRGVGDGGGGRSCVREGGVSEQSHCVHRAFVSSESSIHSAQTLKNEKLSVKNKAGIRGFLTQGTDSSIMAWS